MRSLLIGLLVCSLPLLAYGQEEAGHTAEVKKQTANSAPQTVVETPATRKKEANEHLTDGLNTTGDRNKGPRDAYGTPRPEPLKGQGTNTSTETMRAADKKH
jgi:hypothetical protein